MTRTQRRIVRPVVLAVAGAAMTTGMAVVLVLGPLRYGMDSSAYVATFTVCLLLTLAGIQLATPRRRKTA
jgi:hypothetical protein